MAEIHRLLEQHGKQAVLSLDVDRRVVEAAAGTRVPKKVRLASSTVAGHRAHCRTKGSLITLAGRFTPIMSRLSFSLVSGLR